MDISKNIKTIRESKGLKQSDIAKVLEMERTNYHRLESRGEKLTIEQLQSIAGALGVSVGELLGGEAKVETSSEDFESLKKRVLELEDRLKDKQFKIENIEAEALLFERVVKNAFDMVEIQSESIDDYVSFIERNKWLITFFTGLSYNIHKNKLKKWERWLNAVKIVVQNSIETIFEDTGGIGLQSSFYKRKFKHKGDIMIGNRKDENYEELQYLWYEESYFDRYGLTKKDDKEE